MAYEQRLRTGNFCKRFVEVLLSAFAETEAGIFKFRGSVAGGAKIAGEGNSTVFSCCRYGKILLVVLLILPVEDELEEAESYQAITELEERDLEQLISSCQSAVSNAETFMDGLAKELTLLDEVY